MGRIDIRPAWVSESASIERLYANAMPDEELRPLVRTLLHDTPGVLSLVAAGPSEIVGHVVFTPCRVTCADASVALLGPLVVAPAWRRRGVGGALVRAGLDRLRPAGADRVLVLGDPAYYGRFGFAPERALNAPFALPPAWHDAWQSLGLGGDARTRPGRLIVPPAWDDPKLWAP